MKSSKDERAVLLGARVVPQLVKSGSLILGEDGTAVFDPQTNTDFVRRLARPVHNRKSVTQGVKRTPEEFVVARHNFMQRCKKLGGDDHALHGRGHARAVSQAHKVLRLSRIRKSVLIWVRTRTAFLSGPPDEEPTHYRLVHATKSDTMAFSKEIASIPPWKPANERNAAAGNSVREHQLNEVSNEDPQSRANDDGSDSNPSPQSTSAEEESTSSSDGDTSSSEEERPEREVAIETPKRKRKQGMDGGRASNRAPKRKRIVRNKRRREPSPPVPARKRRGASSAHSEHKREDSPRKKKKSSTNRSGQKDAKRKRSSSQSADDGTGRRAKDPDVYRRIIAALGKWGERPGRQ